MTDSPSVVVASSSWLLVTSLLPRSFRLGINWLPVVGNLRVALDPLFGFSALISLK